MKRGTLTWCVIIWWFKFSWIFDCITVWLMLGVLWHSIVHPNNSCFGWAFLWSLGSLCRLVDGSALCRSFWPKYQMLQWYTTNHANAFAVFVLTPFKAIGLQFHGRYFSKENLILGIKCAILLLWPTNLVRRAKLFFFYFGERDWERIRLRDKISEILYYLSRFLLLSERAWWRRVQKKET